MKTFPRAVFIFPLLFVLFCKTELYSQKQRYINQDYNGKSWMIVQKEIENRYDFRFFYLADSVQDFNFNISSDSILFEKALKDNFRPFGLSISIDNQKNVFIVKGQKIATKVHKDFFKALMPDEEDITDDKPGSEYLNTKSIYIPQTVVIGNKKAGSKKINATISGKLINSSDDSPVINGTIYITEENRGLVTDEAGKFMVDLRKGTYTFKINSLETEEKILNVILYSDGSLNIKVDPHLYLLDEIVISSNKHHNVRGTQMGFERIDTKQIKEIPVVMGERDIIRVALLLPGVQSVGEGSSGFNVRGSPADQNMFYINKVPVYNTSHLFGFFSAFNADAVSDFSLMKSNIPSEYGGRLSSIFNIHAKEGNIKKFSVRGGISPITGNLMVENPIVKNKSSFLLGARSTYSNWILDLVDDPTIRNSKAYFGDAIANFKYKLNPNNELRVFGYYSYDDATISDLTKYEYQNIGASIDWLRIIKDKHSLALTFTAANYHFENNNMEYDFAAYHQTYDLNHNELKANFNFRPNQDHSLLFGINSKLYYLSRGDFEPLNEDSSIETITFEPEQGIENGIYISDTWKISGDLEISGGLRYNFYSYFGPKTVYQYIPGFPKEVEYITDTIDYSKNENIVNYHGLDYRIGAKYLLNDNMSLKGSYNRLHQYIFMLSNTIAISPTDTWKLADPHIKPMVGDQYSLGYYTNIMGGFLEFSVEGYYKKVNNLVEYKDGADLVINEIPETEVIQGDLDTYGIEFMIRKPGGKLNGWLNYTYSRAEVVVNNTNTGEQNNFGYKYPANYDKPHSFNIVANYKLSKRLSFSGNIVYSTGRPITYPTAIYYLDDMEITNYSLRNEYRLPDYFRVDVSMNLEGNLKRNKLIHGSWSVSVYNLTGRRNAYSVYFKSENGSIKGYRLSIFGVPIFSISYNFKLGNYDD